MEKEKIKISEISLNEKNPRLIKDNDFYKLVNSLLVFPKMMSIRPVVIDSDNIALGGNMRTKALRFISKMTISEIKQRLSVQSKFINMAEAEQEGLINSWEKFKKNPVTEIVRAADLTDEEKNEFIIKDNASYGEWDWDVLANEWDAEQLDEYGVDVWQEEEQKADKLIQSEEKSSLEDRFIIPPFSVLDTRKGYWQDRKKLWRGEIGDLGNSREDTLIKSPEIKYKDIYQRTRVHREALGLTFKEYIDAYVSQEEKDKEDKKILAQGVSIFDPVLSELSCRWFMPTAAGGKIFDPFAGDTYKGLVFAICGHEFTGIELRQEQVDINNEVLAGRNLPIRYICDDAVNVWKHVEPNSQDMLFSCPPYYNLEKYSDLPNDASNQADYGAFLDILKTAYGDAVRCLKKNRFAIIVVGDIRNTETSFYYNFVDDIKRMFADFGCPIYNEMILVETAASTALRAGRYMQSRKVAKMHQNILVFYKGAAGDIRANFPVMTFTKEELNMFSKEAAGDAEGEWADTETEIDL